MAAIVVFGPLCGANFNPAVTVSVFMMEGRAKAAQNCLFCLMIIASQIVGCILGVAISYGCMSYNDATEQLEPAVVLLCPPPHAARIDTETGAYECAPKDF